MPKVLSVGQCGFDHGTIVRQLGKAFGAEVVGAGTFSEAVHVLRSAPFDLILVNRISDEDGSSGIDLIRTLKSDPSLKSLAVMLVSNYAEAQQEAESLGALPGFGKGEINTPETRERLQKVLARES
ncbi:MAG: response regulator [Isosphaeraceae bacterium]